MHLKGTSRLPLPDLFTLARGKEKCNIILHEFKQKKLKNVGKPVVTVISSFVESTYITTGTVSNVAV